MKQFTAAESSRRTHERTVEAIAQEILSAPLPAWAQLELEEELEAEREKVALKLLEPLAGDVGSDVERSAA